MNLMRYENRDLHVGAYLGGGKESGEEYLKEIVCGQRQYKQRCNVC